MATASTASFDLDVLDLVEEAYERAGLEARSGYDFRTARRSLNLITQEWANRGLNLWTLSQGTLTLTQGVSSYTLPADTIDLIEHTVAVPNSSSEVALFRVSVSDYAAISQRTRQAQPLQIFIQRSDPPVAMVWPVPDQGYVLTYWRLRRMKDATGGAQTMDVPSRFLPALAAALAYQLAMKRPEATARIPMLQAEYERQWGLAADEDRDRASLFFVPGFA